MQVSAHRAADAVRDAVARAGIANESAHWMRPRGWVGPRVEAHRVDGFALQPGLHHGVRWHLVTGTAVTEAGRTREVPASEMALRVRDALEGLGIRVDGTALTHEDDEHWVAFGSHPDWLAPYDPENFPPRVEGPRLTAFTPDMEDMPGIAVRGALPGYDVGGQTLLTEESVRAMVEASQRHPDPDRCTGLKLTRSSDLLVERPGRPALLMPPVDVVNHWGDAVRCWEMPCPMIDRGLADVAVRYVVDGEMRWETPFALYDAQFGPAPWHDEIPPAPRP